MTKALAVSETFSLAPRNFAEAKEFAQLISTSDLAPKDYRGKPANIIVAIGMGADLGLSPMQALQNIAVINGRPCVWGDAMLAICQAHIDFEDIEETISGTGDARIAKCVVRRKGQKPAEVEFSVDDAKLAGLWGSNVWAKYPKRMLQMRARGFALRDKFADALKGLISREEAEDIAFHESKVKLDVLAIRPLNDDDVLLSDDDLREKALADIHAAQTLADLNRVAEWIKNSRLTGEHLNIVRGDYKIKLQDLGGKVDEAKERLRRTKEKIAAEEHKTSEVSTTDDEQSADGEN